MDATKDSNLRQLIHPPLLKIFKRDGVLIFESKKKAAVNTTLLAVQTTRRLRSWFLALLLSLILIFTL
jgi:hypothetical protein